MSSSAVTETPTVVSTKPMLVIPSPGMLTLSPKNTPTPAATPVALPKLVAAASEAVKGENSSEEGFEPAARSSDKRRSSGVCKWYSTVKGYGFICPQDDGDDVFVHQTAINVSGFRSLQDGECVEFEFYIDENGRRRARNVTGPKGSPVVGQPASRTSWQRESQVGNLSIVSNGHNPAGPAIVPMGYPMQVMTAPVGSVYPYGAAGAVAQPMMMAAADPMGGMRMNGRVSLRGAQVQRASTVQEMAPAVPYMTVDGYGNTYYVDQSGMQRMSMMQPMQPVMEYAPAAPLVAQQQPVEVAVPQRRNSSYEQRRSSLKQQHQRRSITRTSSGSADSYKRNNFHRKSSAENSARFANRIRASLVNQARAQR